MQIAVFGSGYDELVTGACFADVGHDVVEVYIILLSGQVLNNRIVPIFEPRIDTMIVSNRENGRLSFTSVAAEVLDGRAIAYIDAGTDQSEDGSAVLSFVLKVA